MTDVSSNYLAGERTMIETGKGESGMRPRVMTTKSVITGPKADGDTRSVRSVHNSLKNATPAPSVKIDDDEKGSTVDSYASLRIAGSPRVKIRAADNDARNAVDEARFGSEEEGLEEYSDESAYEEGNEEEGDYESDGSFEDLDGTFAGYAKIKLDGSEFDHGKYLERQFSPYARISAPNTATDVEHRKYIDREFSPYATVSAPVHDIDKDDGSYAKISVAGSEIERDAGYARVSVAGSEVDFNYGESNARVSVVGSEGKEMDRESVSGFARISKAGSEAEQNYLENYARLSVAGSDHGRDLARESVARISVAGSEHARETSRALTGYARVSVAGSEYEHGRDAEGGVPSYARISVAGSEAGYRRDPEQEFPGYARIAAPRSEMEFSENRENGYSAYGKVSVVDTFVDLPSPNGSGFKIRKYENELFSESEESEKNLADTSLVQNEEDDGDDDVYETFLELSPEMRAKLEYQVRVVLVCPLFESSRKLSEFSTVYKKKFGRDVEQSGFGTAGRLCRAMPHIVQRSRLEKDGELWLVDSAKNRRAVAGIRSGLRRIVYDVLKESSEKMSFEQLEEKCSEALGKPLVEILTEHGYDVPTVECLVKDMPDLVICEKEANKKGAILSADAEDPALSDGLLLKRSVSTRSISYTPEKKVTTELQHIKETPAETTALPALVGEPQLDGKPRKLKKTPTRLTMRGLRKEIRRHDFRPGPASALDYEILQARIRLRIFLAFHNKGQGVEVSRLLELYESTFKRGLDLQLFAFSSVLELTKSWNDIFLFHDSDPDWVFLAPMEANKRILNTLRTGMRSGVHSVLTSAAPNGLQLPDFLYRLQETLQGKLWEVLQSSGYGCSEPGKLERFLDARHFQLADFEELRLLLDDMMDFVRLGSDDDGCLLVKLNDSGETAPPILDLVDCKMEEADVGSFDELFVKLMLHALNDEEDDGAEDGSEGGSKQSEGEAVAGVPVPLGLVARRIHEIEELGLPLRDTHSPTPASLRFKHEIRLILGSSEYLEKGVAWSELNKVYQDRTGRELGSKAKMKKLLREMPDVVCKECLTERYARLSKTPKNQRILAATRNGYRQVLWWASIFNSGCLWPNLLEGWFLDLDGRSFVACLQECGYEASKSRPLSPVSCFLRDMSDLLEKRSHSDVYTWAGGVEDPLHQDASLLGVPEILIQFDPSRAGNMEEKGPATSDENGDKAARSEDDSCEEDNQSDSGDSEEGSLNGTLEKEVVEAQELENMQVPLESPVPPDTEANNPKVEEVVDGINASQPEVEEPVLTDGIPEEIAKESAMVEDKAQVQHLPDESVESATVEVVPPLDSGERITESAEVSQSAAAESLNENRFHSGEEYNWGGERGADNEDKKVFVSGSRDAREEGDERAYVRGDILNDVRREDERVYSHGNSSEGLKVRIDENDKDVEDPVAHVTREDERVYVGGNSKGLKVRRDEKDEDLEDSVANAYAQLRVAGKGPAVNLDEWVFTDSDEDYDAEEDDEDDDGDYEEDEDVDSQED
ncbi:hypothetical protein R1sor_009468 [Riccia sorocarpa]|uniref:HTH OST-type domain-containing protein n=1 Tax=Riccia sorocarpa TaxID=122646 RepID=A0ABD3HXX6_9MARC